MVPHFPNVVSTRAGADTSSVLTILIKRFISSLARALENLCKTSLETGRVPERLKNGITIPISKRGEKGVCGSYSPVVLPSRKQKILKE